MFSIPSDERTSAVPVGSDSVALLQLKEKFSETTIRSVRVTILTLLPKGLAYQETRRIISKWPLTT
jgi:hypothetical protein